MPGNTSVKQRPLSDSIHYPPIYKKDKFGNWAELTPQTTKVWKGRQYTVSEGHKKTKGHFYEGGPFFTYLIQPRIVTRNIFFQHPSGWPKYEGPCNVPGVPVDFGGFKTPSQDDKYLDAYGTTAIARIDPTNPNADLGIALGEIHRDGIPIPGIQAWRRRAEVAKAAGSEYLNAVFGWLPLVKDMKDTGQSIIDGNTILKNYRDNAGDVRRGTRREFEFDDEISYSEQVVIANTSAEVAAGMTNFSYDPSLTVPVTRSSKTTTRRWFSGCFTYPNPNSRDTVGRMLGIGSDADKLFGISLTPELIWELTPWSWAVDWFSNAGEVISNVSSFGLGGLVMRYGYIMEEKTIVDTYSMPASGIPGVTGSMPPSTVTHVIKRRRPANPFGFGLSWDGLSPSQLLITAALGITRLR